MPVFDALFLAAAAPGALAQQVSAPTTADQTYTPARPSARRVQINVTAMMNGAPLGEVAIETDAAGNASVDGNQLLALLEPLLSAAALDTLKRRISGPDFVPVGALNSDSLTIAFDLSALRLNIALPLDARAINQISITRDGQKLGTLYQPTNFSAGLSLNFANRFNHVRNFDDIDREPFEVLAQGFVNVGGIDGVNLAFEGGLRERGRLSRQRTVLFHDDVSKAIRYSMGDINPQPFGSYGSSLSVIGVGVERLYETIQPYRNLRPSGRGSLSIERPSRVDVIVNGSLSRTLDLAPGKYNLRDFSFVDGLNQVQLVVRDQTGREETIDLSFFSDVDLIEADVSIFSATLGFRRERFGDFRSPTYRDSPMFSGFYQRGITDSLTVGATVQADRRSALLASQVIIGTKAGIFALEGALDLTKKEQAQLALTFSYRLQTRSSSGRSSGLDIDVQYQSARFSPMEEAGSALNDYSWELSARYQRDLPGDVFATVTAGYATGRGSLSDRRSAGTSLTRRFGLVNVSASYDYRRDERGTGHRGLISMSIPLGRQQYARSSYQTQDNRVSVGYARQSFGGLNATDVRVDLARSDIGRQGNLEVGHFSNRFQGLIQHSYDRTQGSTAQFTEVSFTTGIGFAGGKFAIGREAANGFAIVERHSTLRSKVAIKDTASIGRAAETGALGAALVPTRRTYQPTSLKIDVDNLPTGYDIGPGRYDILPGAASGYRITVGSAASRSLVGRLLDGSGVPMAYATGRLVPLAPTGGEPIVFFTNRGGRLAASQIAPGRYRIVLAPDGLDIGEVTIPEDGPALVDIGELRTGGPK